MLVVVGSFVCCSVVILFACCCVVLCDNRDLQGCCVVSCGSVGNNKVARWCGGGVCGYPQGYWWLVDGLRVVDNFVDGVWMVGK